MADVSQRRGFSKPRKALSFLFPSARAWYNNDQKRSGRIGRNASFGYFSTKRQPAAGLDEEEEGTTVAGGGGGLTRKDTVSSTESSIDKHSPNRMTFRVMNPDDTLSTTSSSSTNSSRIDNEEDDNDESDREVIHYQTHQDEEDDHRTNTELGNDMSTPSRGNIATGTTSTATTTTTDINRDAPVPHLSSPPPPPPAHALSTPPSTEPSLSSSDQATTTAAAPPTTAAAGEAPTTPVGSHWYAQGWKIAGAGGSNGNKKDRQSKVMEEEVMEDEHQRQDSKPLMPPAIKTSIVLGAALYGSNNNHSNSGPATPALSPTTQYYHGDRSRSSFDTFRQQSSSEDSPFPSPGSGGVGRSDSTKIEKPAFPSAPAPPTGASSNSGRLYSRGTPAYTRPRPMPPPMVLAPPLSPPPLAGSGNPASRTPSMATVGYHTQPLTPQFQLQHPMAPRQHQQHIAAMTPTHAKGSFIIQNNGSTSNAKKQKTYFSKYAKASYSLTNHPDAIKIYRSMAEKTGDPVIQLSYAKYLLEIAELYGGGGGGQGEGISSPSSGFSNQGMRSSTSVVSFASSSRHDVGRPMSLDGYQSAASSRVSLDSVRSAPMASSSSSAAATATQHRLNDSERRKKKMLEDEGIRWIKRLAKQNVGEAAYLQATWMEKGRYGFSRNSTKTFKLYKIAANEGIPEAMHKVAVSYERSGDVRQAFLNYKGAAAQGVVEAIFRMAKVHLHGEFNQQQNMSIALELLSQAAERANEACPEPPYLFGLILTNTYPKADIPMEVIHRYGGELAALRYFEHAAQLGYSHAQSRIAFIYEYGMYGAPMHLAKSFGYYDLAAKQHNHPQAMLGLSRLYNRGCRGPNDMLTEDERLARDVSGWLAATARNEDAAFSWCQKAADRGLDEALFLLGWYYETGVGVPRDSIRAQELYQKAGAKGHKAAAERQYKSVTLQQHERRSIRPQTTTSCIIM